MANISSARMLKANVFISYSRKDVALVKPIVDLMRLKPGKVFFDLDSIKLGDKWRDKLREAINDSDLVVVFWCGHSSASAEVIWECETAIERGKNVLPVLLDSTPLPPKLCEYQWLDFKNVLGKMHGTSSWKLRHRIANRITTIPPPVLVALMVSLLIFGALLVFTHHLLSRALEQFLLVFEIVCIFVLYIFFLLSMIAKLIIKPQFEISDALLAGIDREIENAVESRENDDTSNDHEESGDSGEGGDSYND